MMSEIFYTFLVTSLISCTLATLRMIYKSKCRSCKIWGIEIIRDVQLEERIDELDLQRSKAVGNNTVESEESKKV